MFASSNACVHAGNGRLKLLGPPLLKDKAMSSTLKALLLAAVVLAVMAMSATTASATAPVEVHDETGNHCNPCDIVIEGESQIVIAAVVAAACEDV